MMGQTAASLEALRIVLDESFGLRRDQLVREMLSDFDPADKLELSKAATELAQLCLILSREPQ